MRRALVLVDETARHPFLRSLPPHVRQIDQPYQPAAQRGSWLADLRHFLMAYTACFLAVTTFIS